MPPGSPEKLATLEKQLREVWGKVRGAGDFGLLAAERALGKLAAKQKLFGFEREALEQLKASPFADEFIRLAEDIRPLRQLEKAATDVYRRLAGEVEARLVPVRQPLGFGERLSKPPFGYGDQYRYTGEYGYDVPPAEQVLMDVGEVLPQVLMDQLRD